MRRAITHHVPLLLLLSLATWAYWPGLEGPLLLDDEANLRVLENTDAVENYPGDIVWGNRSGPLGRAIPMFSFLMETRVFGEDTWVRKLGNLLLHLFNACLVYRIALLLFDHSRQRHTRTKALLASAFWLLCPLLLSTVLYVIQRMAILSATFTLLALLFYCLGRLGAAGSRRAYFPAAGLCVGLALMSKENGVLAPALILLVEACVLRFQGLAEPLRRRCQAGMGLAVIAVAGLLVAVPILLPDFLLSGYVHRSFSFQERMLTEARVLWDYLGLLAWGDLGGLGVYHDDYPVSSDIASPVATLWAVLAWSLVALGAAYSLYSGRALMLTFAVGFFLVGHALESTFYPLEIYFEHRNYLPAVGFYIGLVGWFGQIADRFDWLRGWLLLIAMGLLGRSLLLLGMQASLWSNSWLIHMSAVNHHPESERALMELGRLHAAAGEFETATALLERTHQGEIAGIGEFTQGLRRAYFHCLSNRPLGEDFEISLKIEAPDLRRGKSADALYGLMRLHSDGRCPDVEISRIVDHIWALAQTESGERLNPKLLSTLLLLENNLQRYEQSMAYASQLLQREPENVMALQFMLYLGQVLGETARAEFALAQLRQLRSAGKLNQQEVYNLGLFDPSALEKESSL